MLHLDWLNFQKTSTSVLPQKLTLIFKQIFGGIGEASVDILFMIQSHAESMKKIMGALQDLPAN
jgi:hypothetical protein